MRRIAGARWPLEGASDHGVSEALYLSDPDGLGIEIYADRPREAWERPPDGHGVRMVTLPLDIEDLLAQGEPRADARRSRAGTRIGHVHLKVADVPRAAAFYRDALGFERAGRAPVGGVPVGRRLPPPHRAELVAERGRRARADSAPGLRLIEFELPGAGARGRAGAAARADPAVEQSSAGEERLTRAATPTAQALAFAQA